MIQMKNDVSYRHGIRVVNYWFSPANLFTLIEHEPNKREASPFERRIKLSLL